MSRCFPYPPLEYLRNGARGEAKSESSKLQRDGGKAITVHDKKKKEKKEKKKRRNKNRKENKEGSYIVDTCNQQEKGLLPKGKEEEAERSGLTEEHEQPVCSQSLCHSPDSTRSSKRKGDDLSYDGIKRNGNIIRIRLPLQRHRDVNASISGEQLCPSGKSSLPQQKEIIHIPSKEQCLSINSKTGIITSGPIEAPCSADLKPKTTAGILSHGKGVQTAESLYKALIGEVEEWVPPPLDQDNFDDQQWLFGTKMQERHLCKRLKSQRDESCHESSTFWPASRHLPEVDIWALPYTIPF